MIKESMCERERKGERGTETEKYYFPWVYLLTRFVACFMKQKLCFFGNHFMFSCVSSKNVLISFPGISSI